MNILLISGYDALSHQRWTKGLVALFPEIHFDLIAFPGHHYSWRSASNGLEILTHQFLQKTYDVVLCTSVFDLVTLRACHPGLGKRWLVYFHENQFAYPSRKFEPFDFNLALNDLKRARVADGIAFNSSYNKESFCEGVKKMIKITPKAFNREVLDVITKKSVVIPVGIDESWFEKSKSEKTGVMRILWNHRWEYDKGPDLLLEAISGLVDAHIDFELYIAGQAFRDIPPSFQRLEKEFSSYIKQFGKVESREEYQNLVSHCDVVLSTSNHEFQGLAMLESIAQGCYPIAPHRLVYPEYLPSACLYSKDENLLPLLLQTHKALQEIRSASLNVEEYKWGNLKEAYSVWFSSAI